MYKVLIYYYDDTTTGFYCGAILDADTEELAHDLAEFIVEDENVHHAEIRGEGYNA